MKNKNVKTPNLRREKQDVLYDMEGKKQTSARNELLDSLKRKLEEGNTNEYNNIEQYINEANSRKAIYNPIDDKFNNNNFKEEELKLNNLNKDMSRRAYVKDLKEVIESSDVILEVLDARDPMSCRSKDLETQILSHKTGEKKIILVLNKIDLVPM
jgi:nuclear GTP-binding protein